MHAKKSLGQNFLMHAETAERIAAAANLPENATVLEVGPGTGMLTRALLSRAARVLAIEADASLISTLEARFAKEIGEGKLDLIHADVRTLDTAALPPSYHLVANIPYYITGELIRTFLTARPQPSSITFLVQKEVAERIARSTKEGILSIAVKAYGTPKLVFTVPRGAFVPAPSVDSAVLHISGISRQHFATPDAEEQFFKVLRAGFAHKRKQLAGNLEEFASRSRVEVALSEAGILPRARAEDITLDQWLSLAATLA
jgi:16S rRNA (adenine1518-N6/adenine1519-N6)-dimethyltransferase